MYSLVIGPFDDVYNFGVNNYIDDNLGPFHDVYNLIRTQYINDVYNLGPFITAF